MLVVTKLDRLARSMADLVAITSKLKAKGVELQVLAMNLDTSTPTGKLMLNLMGSFAEFEREIMLERQREGVAKAPKSSRTSCVTSLRSSAPRPSKKCRTPPRSAIAPRTPSTSTAKSVYARSTVAFASSPSGWMPP